MTIDFQLIAKNETNFEHFLLQNHRSTIEEQYNLELDMIRFVNFTRVTYQLLTIDSRKFAPDRTTNIHTMIVGIVRRTARKRYNFNIVQQMFLFSFDLSRFPLSRATVSIFYFHYIVNLLRHPRHASAWYVYRRANIARLIRRNIIWTQRVSAEH